MSNFDARFIKDEELHGLLEKWSAPDPPESLDNRVAAAYNILMGDAAGRPEVMTKMKFCNTCHEEFADRFSFCPVDGSPLSVAKVTATPPTVSEIETSYQIAETGASKAVESEPGFLNAETSSRPVEPVASSAASTRATREVAASAGMIGEFHLTILEDRSLAFRLSDELRGVAHNYQLTWPEFKRDPFGFVKRSVVGYGQMVGAFFGTRNVALALSVAIVAIAALCTAIFLLDRSQSKGVSRTTVIGLGVVGLCGLMALFATWMGRDKGSSVMGAKPTDSRNAMAGIMVAFTLMFALAGVIFLLPLLLHSGAASAQSNEDDLELTQMISDIPNEQPTPDKGTAGMAKGNGGGSKPKQEKAGGGGGGGRQEQTPASFGKLPQADLRIPQVVAPDPHPPVIKNPALPMPATLDADPVLFPPDTRNLNYGDPKSKSTIASSGPGQGNGIGSGNGAGVGPGNGGGYGPGNGGNTGGGDRREGGGGPGGGGGGTDYNKVFNGKDVTTKARVLEKPEALYTEEARKNQITGVVILRAVFSSSGQVTNIVPVSRLPNGLTEKAIVAARLIKFIPATKDGHNVSQYIQLEYNFNLY